MSDPIPLFSLSVVTWDVTDPWQFYGPLGDPKTMDLTERKWMFECEHEGECDLDNAALCGNPIGYRLVQEMMSQTP